MVFLSQQTIFFSFPRLKQYIFSLVDPDKLFPPPPLGHDFMIFIGLLNFLYFFFMCGENKLSAEQTLF